MPKTPLEHFAANLHRLRTAAGLTQAQLAGMVGVRQATLSDLERGQSRPTFATLHELTEALDCTLDDLCSPAGKRAKKLRGNNRNCGHISYAGAYKYIERTNDTPNTGDDDEREQVGHDGQGPGG